MKTFFMSVIMILATIVRTCAVRSAPLKSKDGSFLRGCQSLPVVLSGSQWFSMVTSGSQWFSVVINGYQWFSVVLNGYQWFLMVPSG